MRGICFILSMLIVNVMSQCKNFKCDPDNETKVNFKGFVFDCPKDKYCNRLADEDDEEESCKLPCVELPCGSLFKCNDKDNTLVEIGGSNFQCNDGFICSYTKNPDCMPCVPGKCPENEKPVYECIPDNEKKFKLDGYIGECQGELVCNKDFEPPCKKPCINKGKSASGSTTATTTIATATTPVNEQPCTSNRTSNCIEGQRGLYYYRCRSYLNGTIASNLRSCEDINFDVVCYKSGVC